MTDTRQPGSNSCTAWLETNKVWFETIAATLLSIMAIIIACVEIGISRRQTRLAEIQTSLAEQELARESRHDSFAMTAHWQRLRDGMWTIFDHYPRSGLAELEALPRDAKVKWFRTVRNLLDAQTDNPVLIENRACLGSWRNAITGAKTSAELFETTDMSTLTNWCSVSAGSIMKDVSFVWITLILGSHQVSPVGGRPPEARL